MASRTESINMIKAAKEKLKTAGEISPGEYGTYYATVALAQAQIATAIALNRIADELNRPGRH